MIEERSRNGTSEVMHTGGMINVVVEGIEEQDTIQVDGEGIESGTESSSMSRSAVEKEGVAARKASTVHVVEHTGVVVRGKDDVNNGGGAHLQGRVQLRVRWVLPPHLSQPLYKGHSDNR